MRSANYALLFLICCVVCLSGGCSTSVEEYVAPSNAMTVSNITTLEELCQWSNTIVKAKYVRYESFDNYQNVYLFEPETDFTGNVEDELIHVYEDKRTTLIEGKSYYLFMAGYRSALYPHIVYSRVKPSFLLGEENTLFRSEYTFYKDYTLDAEEITDFSTYLTTTIVAEGRYATAAELISVEETSFEDAVASADRIVLVTLLSSKPANPYVATCTYRIDRTIYHAPITVQKREITDPDVRAAAGLDNEKTSDGATLAPIDAEVGSQWLVLEKYNPYTGGFDMYSGEHFIYAIDSEEADYILSLYPTE